MPDAEANIGVLSLIATPDCGFATVAGQADPVVPAIVRAGLAALTEGARITLDRLRG